MKAQLRDDPQAIDWADEQQQLTRAVLPFYDTTLSTAAEQAASTLPVGVDWEQVNSAVLKLAQEEAARFAEQATDTSQAQVSQVVADWIESGGDMKELTERITQVWSGPRADYAASTEVTRLYATGNQKAYEASGVVEKWRWATAADDRVCPICGPLDGQEFDISNTADLPPKHVQCRCWIVPIVAKPEEL